MTRKVTSHTPVSRWNLDRLLDECGVAPSDKETVVKGVEGGDTAIIDEDGNVSRFLYLPDTAPKSGGSKTYIVTKKQ